MPLNAFIRDAILQAAAELIYAEGFSRVGVERIAERAGVTKRTLYNHFDSKDALVVAYLEAHRTPTLDRYRAWLDAVPGSFAVRFDHAITQLQAFAEKPGWRGCGFTRVASDLADQPNHPARLIAARYKADLAAMFEAELAAEGCMTPSTTARRLLMLLDGCVTEMMIHRDTSYCADARDMAAEMLGRCCGTPKAA